MKTYRSENNSGFHFRHTGIVATLVVIISMIIGAWTMAALAITTESHIVTPPDNSRLAYYNEDEITRSLKEAEREREKALKAAAKERKEALREAKKEREKALKAAKEALRVAKKEREDALKEAEAEREMALKEMERERKRAVRIRNYSISDSQDTRTVGKNIRVPVRPFSKIAAGDNIFVILTQGESSGYAEIEGDARWVDMVEFSYDHGCLHIGYSSRPDNMPGRTVVYLSTQNLEDVNLHKASGLLVQGVLKIRNLYIRCSEASTINLPSVIGTDLKVSATGASNVTLLNTEVSSIEVNASGASQIKIKGICGKTVTAKTLDAAVTSLYGRCNKKRIFSSDIGKINDQGLIIENQKVDCNDYSPKRLQPRQP